VSVGDWLWVAAEGKQAWRVAQVVGKDGRSLALKAQVLASGGDGGGGGGGGGGEGGGSSSSWEPLELEHGRFPVLRCHAAEVAEVADADAAASDPHTGAPSRTSTRASSSSSAAAAASTLAEQAARAQATAAVAATVDLSSLPQLHEASVVHTLHRRSTAAPFPEVRFGCLHYEGAFSIENKNFVLRAMFCCSLISLGF
jgi:hypothetical protein